MNIGASNEKSPASFVFPFFAAIEIISHCDPLEPSNQRKNATENNQQAKDVNSEKGEGFAGVGLGKPKGQRFKETFHMITGSYCFYYSKCIQKV
ncbi:hypothetical protein N9P30_01575 [Alphaproteobacteria bacterium]|nr:hypothetical protein [Alphaproteobacteria bacterium]